MKRFALVFAAFILSTSLAWAGDPDLEGRITRIDYVKSTLYVRNELKNQIGNRDYRVLVKQGMINDYKHNDRLKVWLMADGREASMIERVSR